MDDFTLDPTLYDGRPADCAGRDAVEIACYDFLDSLGVRYQLNTPLRDGQLNRPHQTP